MDEQQALQALKASGKYQILTRLEPVNGYQAGEPSNPRLAMVLDTETTGLDTSSDKIIELGFVVCRYDADSGVIYDVVYRYDGFEDPGEPLADVIKDLTGIDDAMVKDQAFDDADINGWLEKVDLIIAHNASFDRKMVERRFPAAINCNWACSINDIDWKEEGLGTAKLDYLAYRFGFFFEGHRAVNDAEATLHLLTMQLPKASCPAMWSLLQSCRQNYVRIVPDGNTYPVKDQLKEQGYMFNGTKKVWHKKVLVSEQATELKWLTDHVYTKIAGKASCIPLTPLISYSIRDEYG